MGRRKRVNLHAFSFAEGEHSNDIDQSVESESRPVSTTMFSVFDRFGGIDGIMSMIGKIQKMFGIYQQVRPAFKMISTFIGPKATVMNITNKNRNAKRKLTGKRNLHRINPRKN
ncbi:hypothetical protein [Paenibacillus sp. sgz302251]|uniref:hypothetical protein n=1 Tax=Paenibacillus sp. sgz302251 TaxID=3414493 RepID=UPI003C7972E4